MSRWGLLVALLASCSSPAVYSDEEDDTVSEDETMPLPLTGSLLTQYNNLPCIPPTAPLGDLLNEAAAGGGSGLSILPVSATGDNVIGSTPEAVGTTAAFVVADSTDLAFSISSAFDVQAEPISQLIVTAELVNDANVVVASQSIGQTGFVAFTIDRYPMTIAGTFGSVPAGTYTVRLMASIDGVGGESASSVAAYLGGFVLKP